jgi:hypothetical protein
MGILNDYSKYVDQECSYARVDDFLQACLLTLRKRKKPTALGALYSINGHLCHLSDLSTLDRVGFYYELNDAWGCPMLINVGDVKRAFTALETL